MRSIDKCPPVILTCTHQRAIFVALGQVSLLLPSSKPILLEPDRRIHCRVGLWLDRSWRTGWPGSEVLWGEIASSWASSWLPVGAWCASDCEWNRAARFFLVFMMWWGTGLG